MSRLISFYERVFEAPVTLDLEEDGLRHDPDGGVHEVVWMKPGAAVGATLKRADWTTVQMN